MNCSICEGPRVVRGLCRACYQRERSAGKIEVIQPHKPHDGRRVADNGYVYLYWPDHPLAQADGYVSEHRAVAFEAGLLTDPSLHVHHVNEDKQDNRLSNLEVMSNADHVREHAMERGISNQYGSGFPALSAAGAECDIEGCQRRVSGLGLCAAHRSRLARTGNPLAVRRVSVNTIEPYVLVEGAK